MLRAIANLLASFAIALMSAFLGCMTIFALLWGVSPIALIPIYVIGTVACGVALIFLSTRGMEGTPMKLVASVVVALVSAALGSFILLTQMWGFDPYVLVPACLLGILVCGFMIFALWSWQHPIQAG